MELERFIFSNQTRVPFEVLGYQHSRKACNMCFGKSDTEFEGVANQWQVQYEIHARIGNPHLTPHGGSRTRDWIAQKPEIEPNTTEKKVIDMVPNDIMLYLKTGD